MNLRFASAINVRVGESDMNNANSAPASTRAREEFLALWSSLKQLARDAQAAGGEGRENLQKWTKSTDLCTRT